MLVSTLWTHLQVRSGAQYTAFICGGVVAVAAGLWGAAHRWAELADMGITKYIIPATQLVLCPCFFAAVTQTHLNKVQ